MTTDVQAVQTFRNNYLATIFKDKALDEPLADLTKLYQGHISEWISCIKATEEEQDIRQAAWMVGFANTELATEETPKPDLDSLSKQISAGAMDSVRASYMNGHDCAREMRAELEAYRHLPETPPASIFEPSF